MNVPVSTYPTPPYKHIPLFPLGNDETPYRKIAIGGVRVERVMGEDVVVVPRAKHCARCRRPRSTTSIICCARRISPH